MTILHTKGRDSVDGITKRYGLDGQGIESRWGVSFSAHVQTAVMPIQPPIKWVPDFSRGKAAGSWR